MWVNDSVVYGKYRCTYIYVCVYGDVWPHTHVHIYADTYCLCQKVKHCVSSCWINRKCVSYINWYETVFKLKGWKSRATREAPLRVIVHQAMSDKWQNHVEPSDSTASPPSWEEDKAGGLPTSYRRSVRQDSPCWLSSGPRFEKTPKQYVSSSPSSWQAGVAPFHDRTPFSRLQFGPAAGFQFLILKVTSCPHTSTDTLPWRSYSSWPKVCGRPTTPVVTEGRTCQPINKSTNSLKVGVPNPSRSNLPQRRQLIIFFLQYFLSTQLRTNPRNAEPVIRLHLTYRMKFSSELGQNSTDHNNKWFLLWLHTKKYRGSRMEPWGTPRRAGFPWSDFALFVK